MKTRYTLAFDIKGAGTVPQYDSIAYGAVVVDQENKIRDSYYATAYVSKETIIQEQYQKFWNDRSESLKEFIVPGDKNENHRKMVDGFVDFIIKWRLWERENSQRILSLVTDNPSYDVNVVNFDIHRHNCGVFPLPYIWTKRGDKNPDYGRVWDTDSMLKGLLLVTQGSSIVDTDWGLSDIFIHKFNFSPNDKLSDHLPVNSAYNIAVEFNRMLYLGEKSNMKNEIE